MFDWRDYELAVERYQKIFGRKLHKATYRGASGSKLHQLKNLTRSEAKHFLLHDPDGRALLRDSGGDIDTLADHVVEASQRATNKRNEASKMDRMTKNVRSMGEAEYTRIVGDYAKRLYPELSRERAFTKVFTADDAASQAIRYFWKLAKQGSAAVDEDERDDDDEDDALEELERLAEQERRRENGMSKAQAFAKVYQDPANVDLVKRERRQNRPRA